MNATAIAEAPTAESVDSFPRGGQWEVHKFGGTCMATPDRIRSAATLVANDPAACKVVVVRLVACPYAVPHSHVGSPYVMMNEFVNFSPTSMLGHRMSRIKRR